MEDKTIQEINKTYSKIKSVSDEDKHFSLDRLVSNLIEHVEKLTEYSVDSNLNRICITVNENLYRTLRKEVAFAKSSYDKAHKRNAAKIKFSEYQSDLDVALAQVNSDFSILNSLINKL